MKRLPKLKKAKDLLEEPPRPELTLEGKRELRADQASALRSKAREYSDKAALRELVVGNMIDILEDPEAENKDRIGAARMLAQDPALGFVTENQGAAVVITKELLEITDASPWGPRQIGDGKENDNSNQTSKERNLLDSPVQG